MPKNGKKKKNAKNKSTLPETKKVIVYKEDMQEYAKMTKMLGDRRIMVMLPDKTELLAKIPGRFRKRCWIKTGDIILISRRQFQDDKLDVIHKYNDDESKKLAKELEIPDFFLDTKTNEDCCDEDELLWDTNEQDSDDDNIFLPKQIISYENVTNISSDESSSENSD